MELFSQYDVVSGTYAVSVNGKIGIYQAGKGYVVEPSLSASGCQVLGRDVAVLTYQNLFSRETYTVLFQ